MVVLKSQKMQAICGEQKTTVTWCFPQRTLRSRGLVVNHVSTIYTWIARARWARPTSIWAQPMEAAILRDAVNRWIRGWYRQSTHHQNWGGQVYQNRLLGTRRISVHSSTGWVVIQKMRLSAALPTMKICWMKKTSNLLVAVSQAKIESAKLQPWPSSLIQLTASSKWRLV